MYFFFFFSNLIQIFYIPLDYITLSMALWNFVVVGLVSIFWKGPLWLQQAYLTVLSSLMAFSLTGLEQWTTWILLGLLAVWDLIAVLCPFGPLRLLIESSRSQQREVPALLYSVNAVWFMLASPNHFHISHSFSSTDTSVDHPTVSDTKVSHYHQQSRATASLRSLGSLDNYQASTTSSIDPLHHQANLQSTQANLDTSSTVIHEDHPSHRDGFHRLQDNSQTTLNESSRTTDQPQRQQENDTDEEDVERSGLKLGLGDFVFYSVLIARAAMYDWITTVCCTIAVLTGLTATIFLLAIYKKALPALPISIAFGILFYFVAKAVLVPYIAAICVLGMVGI
ncbi:Presenilin-domain-containing protein [Halteromyces radiatus]|uniref:Presenilin-domain-containing protein n=1 Tax=Halteromyces radiatus TaxID=101107 RepID=UPI00221F46AA|nr:Presenilin-domain-containing protein [Halteromyces radiatus]KAI8096274.1 Presenilin-domain-containing protein [Halteromyces radiatus]